MASVKEGREICVRPRLRSRHCNVDTENADQGDKTPLCTNAYPHIFFCNDDVFEAIGGR